MRAIAHRLVVQALQTGAARPSAQLKDRGFKLEFLLRNNGVS
jgi:hypothetical protein